jgi:integrase
MLTDLQIKKLGLPERRREVPDGRITGLYLVLQPSGAKSWAVRYRVNGAPKKLTIGPYPAIDLATARRKALEALGELAGGKDPQAQKKAVREAAKAVAGTDDNRVDRIVDRFVAKHLKVKAKPSWAKEAERLLRVEIIPTFGGRRLGEITRADVRRRLEDIAERAPITANRALAVFRKLCNWAVSNDIIAVSPCLGIEAPTGERSRERCLSDDEVRLAWQAFDAIGWPFGSIAKLLLLTGARRGEVAGMRWSEIDLEAKSWMLPASRTKNKLAHEIPLSDAAVELIASLPRVANEGGFVFSATGRTSVSGFSRAKAAIDDSILEIAQRHEGDEAAPPPPWTVHDLRRTVATGLQKLGVRLEVTEAVLNHVSGSRAGIVGIYQRHSWSDEKRTALEVWARKLHEIVSGESKENCDPPLSHVARHNETRLDNTRYVAYM